MDYQIQNTPNKEELSSFLEAAFDTLSGDDAGNFSMETSQSLADWLSVDELIAYLPYGELWEARDDEGNLVGVAFEGKQHPISWPDGKKAELFVLAVSVKERGKGIGKTLVAHCEQSARLMSAKTLLVNTNSLMPDTISYYERLGYSKMGELQGYYDNGNAVFLEKLFTR